jgi:hypothetical protein
MHAMFHPSTYLSGYQANTDRRVWPFNSTPFSPAEVFLQGLGILIFIIMIVLIQTD